jgi:hypothetical protein
VDSLIKRVKYSLGKLYLSTSERGCKWSHPLADGCRGGGWWVLWQGWYTLSLGVSPSEQAPNQRLCASPQSGNWLPQKQFHNL